MIVGTASETPEGGKGWFVGRGNRSFLSLSAGLIGASTSRTGMIRCSRFIWWHGVRASRSSRGGSSTYARRTCCSRAGRSAYVFIQLGHQFPAAP
jgi:hypothetical protein